MLPDPLDWDALHAGVLTCHPLATPQPPLNKGVFSAPGFIP